MTRDEVIRLGAELGIDALGVTRAEAYVQTERHIVERRERGLFAGMKFTMTRPEQSCHPESLLPGARSVISAAACYWTPESPLEPGEGRLARRPKSDPATMAHLVVVFDQEARSRSCFVSSKRAQVVGRGREPPPHVHR